MHHEIHKGQRHSIIDPYSIDEVFIDVTGYLPYYHMSAHELAMTMVREVLYNTGITATAGRLRYEGHLLLLSALNRHALFWQGGVPPAFGLPAKHIVHLFCRKKRGILRAENRNFGR